MRRRCPRRKIVGIDLLPTDPIDGVTILQMDFMDEDAPERLQRSARRCPPTSSCRTWLRTRSAIQQTDHLRTMALVEAGLEFAREVLRPGGAYVAKVLAGGADNDAGCRAQAQFHDREARQAAGEPQGFERVVRRRSGLQRRGSVEFSRVFWRHPRSSGNRW